LFDIAFALPDAVSHGRPQGVGQNGHLHPLEIRSKIF